MFLFWWISSHQFIYPHWINNYVINEFCATLEAAKPFEQFCTQHIQAKNPGSKICNFTKKENQQELGDIGLLVNNHTPIYFECKWDRRFRQTGNLFIETKSRNSGKWVASGIYSPSKASIWLVGDFKTIWQFDRPDLQALAQQGFCCVTANDMGENPTQGFLLPVSENFKIFWQG